MDTSMQLDLLGLLEETKLEQPAPSLFNSPTRGVAARMAEFEAWSAEHGHFGSVLSDSRDDDVRGTSRHCG